MIDIFPPECACRYCDIGVEFYHAMHPGRMQFGVPLKVREWIQKNPRSTPLAQREELLLAIKREKFQEFN